MAIIKQISGNMVTYSMGEEKVLVASFDKSDKMTLKIDGAIKTLVAPCLDEVIKNAMTENSGFFIDFSGVTYIASAGLRVLLNMQQDIDENEKPEVILINVPDVVREVFEQTGFGNILNIQD